VELADLAGAAGNPSLAANDLPVPNLTRQDRRQIRYYGDNDLRGQLLPVSAFLFTFADRFPNALGTSIPETPR
jgi:hypothetical protein